MDHKEISLLKEFTSSLKTATKEKISGYDTAATVTRVEGGTTWVHIPGGVDETPVETTINAKAGDSVKVRVSGGKAWITGNYTAPPTDDATAYVAIGKSEAANTNAVKAQEIAEIAVKELKAANAEIDTLKANSLTADSAVIKTLESDNAAIKETLTANKAIIDTLEADNVTIKETLDANVADINTLQTDKLSATDATLKYANIDFSNIGEAAMEYLYSKSGLIENITISEGTITGNLVGVTIKGDLIEGGTIVAEKLVVQGEDGLFYKLNTDGITTSAEQTEYNSLNGKIFTAKSITAEKVGVDDLVAFGATIGGFHITDSSLYSGVKKSASNTTRGVYLGNDGQVAFGDADSYIKYYKDEDGNFRLAISAESLTFVQSGKSVEEELDSIREEVTTFLYIGSSRGTVFKNDNISTTLVVTIYRGTDCITDMATLTEKMGDGVSLQWSFQRPGEDTYYQIDPSDSRIGESGFTFTISPDDVDASATFVCELIEEEEGE